MLFLLNDMIVDVEVPEARVQQRWREIGCLNPRDLRANEAIEFVRSQVAEHMSAGYELGREKVLDLAALIISKTGANSLILKPTASGKLEPRLRDLPLLVLETYQRGADNDGQPAQDARKA